MSSGFAFPMVPGTGGFPIVRGADAVARSLRDLLYTEPGERVGRPGYGAGLRYFLFAPNNVETRSRIRTAVVEAIEEYEPRARLEEVLVYADPQNPAEIHLHLRYTVVDEPDSQELALALSALRELA